MTVDVKPPRTAVPKSVRFEVFKRDKFTCQYCGAKAPEAVLQCDHIVPVAEGGGNEVSNLITACQPCNSGKGARLLDDNTVVEKQVDQLIELEERRQQLEMMIQWRQELSSVDKIAEDAIVERINGRSKNFSVSDQGRATVRRWLKRFTLAELLQAVDESFGINMLADADGVADLDSWSKAFNKVPSNADRILQEREKPYIGRLLYVQGVVRNKVKNKKFKCMEALENLHVKEGIPLDELERRAKRMTPWMQSDETDIDNWFFDALQGSD